MQVAAESSSTSVQAVPQCSSSSVQANPAYVSVSVQQGSSSADMATQTTSDETMPVVKPHIAFQEAQALPPPQVQSLPDFEEEMDISDSVRLTQALLTLIHGLLIRTWMRNSLQWN